jgi:luciferase-like monooxygenase
VATHIAAKTTRLRVGTAVIVVPLHHPLVIAEARGVDGQAEPVAADQLVVGEAGRQGERILHRRPGELANKPRRPLSAWEPRVRTHFTASR